MRALFNRVLVDIARHDERIWMVLADIGYGEIEPFRDAFPDRRYNCGVAEQNMTGVACGVAMEGNIAITYSIANFPTLRCLEQKLAYGEADRSRGHRESGSREITSPEFRGCDPPLASFFDQFDVLTLWTWNSDEIPMLEENLVALEKVAPKNARIALGLYIWDYHNRRPVSVELMEQQCEFGLKCLKSGRIRDMIFLANTVLDVGLPSAEFSRQWIKRNGNVRLTP
jgi:hypothetical protein